MSAILFDSRRILSFGSILAFTVLAVLPIFFLVVSLYLDHFSTPTNISFGALQSLYLNSFFFSSGVTFYSLLLGGGLAWLFSRITFHYQFFWLGLFCLPLFIPINILANNWSNLLGQHTGLNYMISLWWPEIKTVFNFSPWISASWVQIMSFYPISLLIFFAAFQRWDQRWSETCYFSCHYRTLHFILSWRYYRHYIGISALLIFIFSFSDFAVADLFQLHVYATEIFLQLSAYNNLSGAIILSLPILLTGAVCLFFLYQSLEQIPLSNESGVNRPVLSKKLFPLQEFILQVFFLSLVIVIVGMPLVNLLITIDNWSDLLNMLQLIWQDMLLSFIISFLATLICVLLALVLSYSIHRKLNALGLWIRLVLLFIFILPSSIIGIAYINFWNQPYLPNLFYQQGLILPFALALLFLPIAVELILLQFKKIPIAEEQAAHLSGIPFYKALRVIVLPRLNSIIKIVFLLCFIFCFNELTISLLITPPGFSSLPVRLFSMVHYGSQSLVATLSVLQLLILATPIFLLYHYNFFLFKKNIQSTS